MGSIQEEQVIALPMPFASIPGRFRQSVLRRDLPSQPFQATNSRPRCPHPAQEVWPYWEAPLPNDCPVLDVPRDDELGCLHLSLTIPKHILDNPSRKKIPVFVFIHGGAFIGGNSAAKTGGREIFDGADPTLVHYNMKYGEEIGNYGLHDQRRAFEWLSEFAGGFGSDPDNITIHETSAGSASCHYQSLFPDRKYKRAILASGFFFGFALLVERQQERFDLLTHTVAPGISDDQALQAVLTCDTRALTHTIQWDLCNPLVDGTFITQEAIRDTLPTWNILDTMVGANAFEEDLSQFLLMEFTSDPKARSDEQIKDVLKESFSKNLFAGYSDTFPRENPGVIASYHLEDAFKHPSQHLARWTHLLGNMLFDIPSFYFAATAQKNRGKGRVWLYRYGATNKYPLSPPSVYRKAHHGVNDLYLFNVAPELVPLEDQRSWNAAVEQTQRTFFEFANGELPWQPVRSDCSVQETAKIGPLFLFADNGESQTYDSLEECVGPDFTAQYSSVL